MVQRTGRDGAKYAPTSVWLITLLWWRTGLRTPGVYGPVQYWTDTEDDVSPSFHVRVLCV
jgi:hypothetical protein